MMGKLSEKNVAMCLFTKDTLLMLFEFNQIVELHVQGYMIEFLLHKICIILNDG